MKCPQRYNGSGKQWLSEDYKLVQKNYNKGNLSKLADQLNCTVKAIRHKAGQLGLRRNIIGKYNPKWKGDKVGFHALHSWVNRHKPKPELCVKCNKNVAYDLANISGEYKRDLIDFNWWCRSCHMKSDGRMNNLKQYSGDSN